MLSVCLEVFPSLLAQGPYLEQDHQDPFLHVVVALKPGLAEVVGVEGLAFEAFEEVALGAVAGRVCNGSQLSVICDSIRLAFFLSLLADGVVELTSETNSFLLP